MGEYRKRQIEIEAIKLRQKEAWDNLYKKVVLDITDWGTLADELDDIIKDFIEQYEATE